MVRLGPILSHETVEAKRLGSRAVGLSAAVIHLDSDEDEKDSRSEDRNKNEGKAAIEEYFQMIMEGTWFYRISPFQSPLKR